MRLPPDHPRRVQLNDEVHARPSESIAVPMRIAYVAMCADAGQREREWQHVAELVRRYGHEPPPPGATHFSADLGPFRLKWERHTEFTRYKFMVPGCSDRDPFDASALDAVPPDWLAELPGETLVAIHAALLATDREHHDTTELSSRHFGGNVLAGAAIAGGLAVALTDYRLHDGMSRLIVFDRGMTTRQAGRMVQRLVEIETYRMLALLALPVAQQLSPWLARAEHELAEITAQLVESGESTEPVLLERLTRLEAEIENREATSHYRFSAAAAYYSLVRRRIEELREVRLPGTQNFQEFTERRLEPAMNTCRSVAARIESLSERVARATQLLSTRVDLTRERQNQQLLESMNQRAAAQLRMQQTVEGLSTAAITYYLVGLVGYAAKGMSLAGLDLPVEIVVAASIPIVAAIVWLGVRHARRVVTGAIR